MTRSVVTIDRVLTLALVAAVGYLAYVQQRAQAPVRPITYAAGDMAPAVTGVEYASAPRTIVLHLQSHCSWCTRSIPFYKTLVGHGVPIVALSVESRTDLDAYLGAQGIAGIRTAQVARTGTKLGPTPDLLVVNQAGRIEQVWTGFLTADQEAEVRELVGIGKGA